MRIECYTKDMRHIGKEVSEAYKDVEEKEISVSYNFCYFTNKCKHSESTELDTSNAGIK